jgi:hypothetical protein
VEAGSSPRGEMGQKYLVAGKRVSMRLWIDQPGGKLKGPTSRDYDWLMPAEATHQYTIIEPNPSRL